MNISTDLVLVKVKRDSTGHSVTTQRRTRSTSWRGRMRRACATSRWNHSASQPCVTMPTLKVRFHGNLQLQC